MSNDKRERVDTAELVLRLQRAAERFPERAELLREAAQALALSASGAYGIEDLRKAYNDGYVTAKRIYTYWQDKEGNKPTPPEWEIEADKIRNATESGRKDG